MGVLRAHDKKSICSPQYFLYDIVFVELLKKWKLVILTKLGCRNEVPAEYDHLHFRSRCGNLFPGGSPCGCLIREWQIADTRPSSLLHDILEEEYVQHAVHGGYLRGGKNARLGDDREYADVHILICTDIAEALLLGIQWNCKDVSSDDTYALPGLCFNSRWH